MHRRRFDHTCHHLPGVSAMHPSRCKRPRAQARTRDVAARCGYGAAAAQLEHPRGDPLMRVRQALRDRP